jgi:hypothetical protein
MKSGNQYAVCMQVIDSFSHSLRLRDSYHPHFVWVSTPYIQFHNGVYSSGFINTIKYKRGLAVFGLTTTPGLHFERNGFILNSTVNFEFSAK